MTAKNIADILADGPVIPVIVIEDVAHAVPLVPSCTSPCAIGRTAIWSTARCDAGGQAVSKDAPLLREVGRLGGAR